MSSPQLVPVIYDDRIVVSCTTNVYFNAAELATTFGKQAAAWLRLDSTKEYIALCSEFHAPSSLSDEPWVRTQRGSAEVGGGTWLHPKLGIAFARWLDPRFAVWCDAQIDKLMRRGVSPAAVESLIEAAIHHDRTTSDRIAYEQRVSSAHAGLKQGLTAQEWADLDQYMYDTSSVSSEADKALISIRHHFNKRYRLVDINFKEALNYLARVREMYEDGYKPKVSGSKVVEDDAML